MVDQIEFQSRAKDGSALNQQARTAMALNQQTTTGDTTDDFRSEDQHSNYFTWQQRRI